MKTSFMRSAGVLAVALGIFLSVPVHAQPKSSEIKTVKPGEGFPPSVIPDYQKTEDINLLGQTYNLTFKQLPETPLNWDDVKQYLPTVLQDPPGMPVDGAQIKQYVDQLVLTAANNYNYYAVSAFQQKKAEHMAAYPNLPEETVEIIVNEKYHSNEGWENSKEAQEAHNIYLSLMYLSEALQRKLEEAPKTP